MKKLPPCDHDGCPPTRCVQTANAKGVGISDGLGTAVRGEDVYEGTWLEVEYRKKNSNATRNWDFSAKYPLPFADEAFASLKNFHEDFDARVVEVFERRTPLTLPEPAAPNDEVRHGGPDAQN